MIRLNDSKLVFYTSDTHFNHSNIIKYCNRPFKNSDEMNHAIISNWNEIVPSNGIVIHLGDFGFGSLNEIFKQLNGEIHLIKGNHDKQVRLPFKSVTNKYQGQMIQVGEQRIFGFHTACRIWPSSHHGVWHLYGHSHGTLSDDPYSLSMDVGVDTHNFKPYSHKEIVTFMKRKLGDTNASL